MPDLLSQSQRDFIRSIIGDVLDTFAKTPVLYRKILNPANDYMEELNYGSYKDYNLMGVIEFTDDVKDKADAEPFLGVTDPSEVRFIFKLEDLALNNLIDPVTNYPLMEPETDLLFCNNTWYRVVYVATGGHFERRGLIVHVWGIKIENK